MKFSSCSFSLIFGASFKIYEICMISADGVTFLCSWIQRGTVTLGMTQARFLGILILGFRGRGFIRVRSAPYCHVTTPGSALYGKPQKPKAHPCRNHTGTFTATHVSPDRNHCRSPSRNTSGNKYRRPLRNPSGYRLYWKSRQEPVQEPQTNP